MSRFVHIEFTLENGEPVNDDDVQMVMDILYAAGKRIATPGVTIRVTQGTSFTSL